MDENDDYGEMIEYVALKFSLELAIHLPDQEMQISRYLSDISMEPRAKSRQIRAWGEKSRSDQIMQKYLDNLNLCTLLSTDPLWTAPLC